MLKYYNDLPYKFKHWCIKWLKQNIRTFGIGFGIKFEIKITELNYVYTHKQILFIYSILPSIIYILIVLYFFFTRSATNNLCNRCWKKL